MTVSVAMTTYNGGRYLEDQLVSVLSQLQANDELIVSDDGSDDGTRQCLDALAAADPRVTVLDGLRQGVVKNVEHAIKACKGDLIFLCDQDDVWHPKKRELVENAFQSGALLVMHDARIIDRDGNELAPSFMAAHRSKPGFVRNILRNSYIGCCMAFSKELLPLILPFPDDIPMHDQWIGLQAEKQKRTIWLSEPLLDYRRHGENVTSDRHGSLLTMWRQRWGLVRSLRRR